MDLIQYLLKYMFKLAVLLFVLALLLWAMKVFFPSVTPQTALNNIKTIFSPTSKKIATKVDGEDEVSSGWLPAPGSYKGLFGQAKTPDENTNVYKPGQAYGGYGNAYNNNQGGAEVNFVTYTASGTQITHYDKNGGVFTGTFNTHQQTGASNQAQQIQSPTTTNAYTQKSLYVRNLSIYEGGHVYTGLTFVGEARNTMFQNGRFPIIIADASGRAVSVSYAEATTNWTVAGWTRFQVKIIGTLPDKVRCTMVFEAAQTANQKTQPARVAIPILCN